MVLKFNKSLYGKVESPHLLLENIKTRLGARGSKKSEVDPCLFIKNKIIFIVYEYKYLLRYWLQPDIYEVIKSFEDNDVNIIEDFLWEELL